MSGKAKNSGGNEKKSGKAKEGEDGNNTNSGASPPITAEEEMARKNYHISRTKSLGQKIERQGLKLEVKK